MAEINFRHALKASLHNTLWNKLLYSGWQPYLMKTKNAMKVNVCMALKTAIIPMNSYSLTGPDKRSPMYVIQPSGSAAPIQINVRGTESKINIKSDLTHEYKKTRDIQSKIEKTKDIVK